MYFYDTIVSLYNSWPWELNLLSSMLLLMLCISIWVLHADYYDQSAVYSSSGSWLYQNLTVSCTCTSITESAICRFLHRQKFSRKKLTKIASQRSEELQEKFLIDCSAYKPEMLVLICWRDRVWQVQCHEGDLAIPWEVCLFPLTIVCYYPYAIQWFIWLGCG